jgi:hypothetical protein
MQILFRKIYPYILADNRMAYCSALLSNHKFISVFYLVNLEKVGKMKLKSDLPYLPSIIKFGKGQEKEAMVSLDQ